MILAILALAAALVVFGYRLRPAHTARWSVPARVVEQRAELLWLIGGAMLAAGLMWLLLFLIAPVP